jgi:hypothetical protein
MLVGVKHSCVVTEESKRDGNVKIPHVYDRFGITCHNIETLLDNLGRYFKKRTTQHALATDGTTGGAKSRRQPRYPHETARRKRIIFIFDKVSRKVAFGNFARRR